MSIPDIVVYPPGAMIDTKIGAARVQGVHILPSFHVVYLVAYWKDQVWTEVSLPHSEITGAMSPRSIIGFKGAE